MEPVAPLGAAEAERHEARAGLRRRPRARPGAGARVRRAARSRAAPRVRGRRPPGARRGARRARGRAAAPRSGAPPVHAAGGVERLLEARAGIGPQRQPRGRTAHARRVEVGRLEQHGGRVGPDAARRRPPITPATASAALRVGDHEVLGRRARAPAVERAAALAGARPPHVRPRRESARASNAWSGWPCSSRTYCVRSTSRSTLRTPERLEAARGASAGTGRSCSPVERHAHVAPAALGVVDRDGRRGRRRRGERGLARRPRRGASSFRAEHRRELAREARRAPRGRGGA